MNKLYFKSGVMINGIRPHLLHIMEVASTIYYQMGYYMTVTSVMDGKHKLGSLHYQGLAFDTRTYDVNIEHREPLYLKLKNTLEPMGCDVILETDHIHIEFDIK